MAFIYMSCNESDDNINDSITASSICIGDLENMIVNTPDTCFVAMPYQMQTYNLDVDYDNFDDYQIAYISGGNPESSYFECYFYSIDNGSFINIFNSVDSIFLSAQIDTSYSGNDVYISYSEGENCGRIYPTDTLIRIAEKKNVNSFFYNDNISISDNWALDSISLYETSSHICIDQIQNGDTLTISYYDHLENCYQLPYNTDCYIGIKKNKNGIEKLGWVKLKIVEFTIYVHEIAIQQ